MFLPMALSLLKLKLKRFYPVPRVHITLLTQKVCEAGMIIYVVDTGSLVSLIKNHFLQI